MKKTLFIVLTLLVALLVCVSCDNSLDADVFTPDPTPETDPNKMPLTLEFIADGNLSVDLHYFEPTTSNVYYSVNGGEKIAFEDLVEVPVKAGDKVTLYRDLSAKSSGPYFVIKCTSDCYVYGNVMSLVDPENYATATEVPEFAFLSLFFDNAHIKNHESIDLVLPATTLAKNCYDVMFSNCTALTKAPELPATTLADYCYYNMFYACSGLTTAPALPAKTLASRCYSGMFQSCTSLEEAPALPATTLANSCYEYMFKECSSLNKVTCMATTNIIGNTENWLEGVAETGDFYKASGATWDTGSASGIPTGWTSHDAN